MSNPWDENRRKAMQASNESIKRGLRTGSKSGKGGGHGKGPHSDTCKANEKLRRLLSRVPLGRPGNVVWCGMQYPAQCEAWFRPSQDAI
jgi:hypothetical protein